jgi:DNA-binding transcriptional ArsR family regulator
MGIAASDLTEPMARQPPPRDRKSWDGEVHRVRPMFESPPDREQSMATRKQRQEERRKALRPNAVRDQIVGLMRGYAKPISPTRIARATGINLGSVAYHVRVLREVGAVAKVKEGRVRGAVEHFYVWMPHDEEIAPTDPVQGLLELAGALTITDTDGAYPRPASVDPQARAALLAVFERARSEVRTIVTEADRRVIRSVDGALEPRAL